MIKKNFVPENLKLKSWFREIFEEKLIGSNDIERYEVNNTEEELAN